MSEEDGGERLDHDQQPDDDAEPGVQVTAPAEPASPSRPRLAGGPRPRVHGRLRRATVRASSTRPSQPMAPAPAGPPAAQPPPPSSGGGSGDMASRSRMNSAAVL